MLSKNEEKLAEVRERTVEILEALTASQKAMLTALDNCDTSKFGKIMEPLKSIGKKVTDIDNLIVTIFALYTS